MVNQPYYSARHTNMAPEANTQNKRYLFHNLLNIMDEIIILAFILHSILLLSVAKVEISVLLGPDNSKLFRNKSPR